ncbi:helix-turn-helix transcriptional regulator (plasmid) [Rhizobium sp. TH2]|uniref:helix-turn-helix transcriptional regulator n=1 Tax=Rhizobium sp. TH2 TaxID=2775403 RepID=UPI0021579833|nr:helix-turn-helix transcriptional regulator [Rhizobium sp. TH2]UVC12163.1 helix-turn-helix transcriptional regulator [Rhizobium sp. TH2]
MTVDLADAIYEAAFVPELWSKALERLAQLSTSVGTALFLFSDGRPTRGRALDSQHEELAAFLTSDTLPFSASVQNVCRAQPSSFVDFDSLLTNEEKANDVAQIRYRSMGIGAHLGTAIPMPSGELVIFVQQRLIESGPYGRKETRLLNRLRPHLARASMIAVRLGLERAENAVNAMETMGFPAAVLSDLGRVRATNVLFDRLSQVFLTTAFGGLAISGREANGLFQQAIRAMREDREPLVRSIPLAPREDRAPLIIHLLPLRRAAHDIFANGDVMLVATTVGASAMVPAATILTGLFDLSPAEAKLATSLAVGLTLKAAAAEQGIQVSTARYYLERVFQKTGTHQQSELVALLKTAQPLSHG